jgi:enoyl-CoA hydratase/carnithine racemase
MELMPVRIQVPRDLDTASVEALRRDLDEALASRSPAVALHGASPEVFCLGLALGRPAGDEPAPHAFSALLTAMHRAPKPLVAVVEGQAIGGGMGLVCACDWVIASDRATFALPELLWGLVPAIIWPVITDRMPAHVARQWTLGAHSRPASEGLKAGLVDDLVPPAELDAAAGRATRGLRRLDPAALCRLRDWARTSRQFDLPRALDLGANITSAMLEDPRVRHRWQIFEAGEVPWSA